MANLFDGEKLNKNLFKADSLLRKDKPLEAVLLLKKTVKEFSDVAYAHYLLGIARMKCGLLSLGKQSFETANKLEPNDAEYLKNLGWAKVTLNDLENGRNDLRNAINLDLSNAQIYLDLAMSYFYAFEFDEAFEWLDRARALDSRDDFILENYKFAEEVRNSFFNLTSKERKKVLKERLDKDMRKKEHALALAKFFTERKLNWAEAEEFNSELKLSDFSDTALFYKGDINKKSAKKDILKKRKEIEKSLTKLIEENDADITLEDIKKIIYNEKKHYELNEIIKKFDYGQTIEEMKSILFLLNDAWNYFPHKCLNGLSPAEKILE